MPRDSSGNYTLPAGNPVIPGTVIQASWANPTMEDIGATLTQSLDRSGRGGMLVPFRNVDGTVQAPGITWAAETSMGFFRSTTNDMQAVVAGLPKTRWVSGGLQLRENDQWQLAASQQWVIDYLNGIDLSNYANLTQNETITGSWRHNATLSLGNNVTLAGWNAADNGTITLAFVDPNNIVQLGSPSVIQNLRNNGDLRLNNAQLNNPDGLVQLNSSGFVPQALLPVSGLTFLGSWDASNNVNPPDGTASGEFYVINVAGTLPLIDPDSGVPVSTPVEPGDYIVWSEPDSGWYYVPRQGLTVIPATDVSYDNSGGYWSGDNVQLVLDEIGAAAGEGFDPANNYTITGSWTFTQALNVDDIILDGDATTRAGIAARNIAGTSLTVLVRDTAADNLFLGNAAYDLRLLGSEDRPSYNAQTMALQTDVPSLQPYTQRAAAESISGDWEFQLNTLFGAGIYTNILNSDGGLSFNGAALNQADGLAQLNAGGLLPPDIVPFLGLDLKGTWNAATGDNPSEANPGTTYNGGDYYVIDVEGTINIIDPADGLYKPTLCEVGNFIVYVDNPEAPAEGWYKVARGGLDEIDASQVLYDPTGTPWVGSNVDVVLGNIGVQATLRERAETITANWTFNGQSIHQGSVRMINQPTYYDSDASTVGPSFRSAAGVIRWLWARQPSDNQVGLWRYDTAGNFVNRPLFFGDGGQATFAAPVNGVAADNGNQFPILSQADGRYTRKAAAETITGKWLFNGAAAENVTFRGAATPIALERTDNDANITMLFKGNTLSRYLGVTSGRLKFGASADINGTGEFIATEDYVDAAIAGLDLSAYAQKAGNETITGAWNFTGGPTVTDSRSAVRPIGFGNSPLRGSSTLTELSEYETIAIGSNQTTDVVIPNDMPDETGYRIISYYNAPAAGVDITIANGGLFIPLFGNDSTPIFASKIKMFPGSVIEVYRASETVHYCFGNGFEVVTLVSTPPPLP